MRISDWSSDVGSSDLQADEAGVGEQLQPQPHPHLFARPAGAVLARGAVGRAFVAGVAAPAVAAAQEGDALALLRQVGEQAALLVVGKNLGADRHRDDQIVAARTGAVPAGAGGGRKRKTLHTSN